MWELRAGHGNEGASNDVQSVFRNEACGRLQSCETKAQRFQDTALQGLRFSSVLLVRHHSDAAEADTIHVSCLSIPSLCVRSAETPVDPKSRHGEADVAMRSLPTVDVEETRRCSKQRRSESSDCQTPDAQFLSACLYIAYDSRRVVQSIIMRRR